MDKNLVIEEVKKMIAAPSCYAELKKAGEDWINSIGKSDEDEKLNILTENMLACISSIDDCIMFLNSDMGYQLSRDKRDDVLNDAEKRKSEGEDTCVCAACQGCKKILSLIF